MIGYASLSLNVTQSFHIYTTVGNIYPAVKKTTYGCRIYNPGHNILELYNILVQTDSPQIKGKQSSIAKLVYELPHELPNDLRHRILGN